MGYWRHFFGYIHGWLDDPFNIPVNEVYTNVDWWWTGNSIPADAGACDDYRWWRETTGWYEYAGYNTCDYYLEAPQYLVSKSWSQMWNYSFCQWSPVRVSYYDSISTGAGNGMWYGTISILWTGSGCGTLLHDHYSWSVFEW